MKLLTKSMLAVVMLLLTFNLSVAEAASGPAGPKGATGATGPMGPKGNPGFPGLLGPKGATGAQGAAGTPGTSGSSCTPHHWGDTGPDGGVVFYVDGSGCHGLEAQAADASSGGTMIWSAAISAAAAYNLSSSSITGTAGLNCSRSAFPSSAALPATPNCWHLPSKTELNYLYEQKFVVGGFADRGYWSSTEDGSNYAWLQGFFDGFQYSYPKSLTNIRVRAVRAF